MLMHRSSHDLLDPIQLCLLLNYPCPLCVTHVLLMLLLQLLLRAAGLLMMIVRVLMLVWAEGVGTDLVLPPNHRLARHYRVLILYQFLFAEFDFVGCVFLLGFEHLIASYGVASVWSNLVLMLLLYMVSLEGKKFRGRLKRGQLCIDYFLCDLHHSLLGLRQGAGLLIL